MARDDSAYMGFSKEELDKLWKNLEQIEALGKRLNAILAAAPTHDYRLNGPDWGLFGHAFASFLSKIDADPVSFFEQYSAFWAQSFRNFSTFQEALAQSSQDGTFATNAGSIKAIGRQDRRFEHPYWAEHPYFSFIKQQYEANCEIFMQSLDGLQGLSDIQQQHLQYFARQFIDMMCPENFLLSNPAALERLFATQGDSLVRGLENLISDVEANNGALMVRLVDEDAFTLGENIACTPGQVVFRNKMMELIHYEPCTAKAFEIPIVIFPPWINKYYVLDLSAQNSFIKWLTEQGYRVFVTSWVNPDPSYRDVGLEDYVLEGYLAAIEQAKTLCNQAQVNVVGYCIGGTVLSLALSLLKQRNEAWVRSATFLTALTDFSNQGEFAPFIQDDFVDGIEAEIENTGILAAKFMTRTFSLLRANDLIYRPAIKRYLMGDSAPAFDLLYWNGDGSNLPGKMAMQYLRGLCQRNELAREGFSLLGHKLQLKDIETPICAIACERDHIVPWRDSFRGFQQIQNKDFTFILAQAGHVAGVINPPYPVKYGHYTNASTSQCDDEWRENAHFHAGSWWPSWEAWLSHKSGEKITINEHIFPNLGAAPGSYVNVSAHEAQSAKR